MPHALSLRALRLVSGLVLALFVATHLVSLAIGLQSLEAMELWRTRLLGVWASPPGTVLLAGAGLGHTVLGLLTLARRRSMALSRIDVLQTVLGIVTPPLLFAHVLTVTVTRHLAPTFHNDYATMLAFYWDYSPFYAFQQLLAVVAVWVHAALGLYAWLVVKPAWRRLRGLVLPLLFGLPILSLLGFAQAGEEVLRRIDEPTLWRAAIDTNIVAMRDAYPTLVALLARAFAVYGAMLAAAVLAFAWRTRRGGQTPVEVAYDGGLVVVGRKGLTILEISRLAGIAHAHVCSGRGRCGTCRVAVTEGADRLSPPSEVETRMLRELGGAAGLRLACQAKVREGRVGVVRLMPAYADASAAYAPEEWILGAPAVPSRPPSAREDGTAVTALPEAAS